MTFSHKLLASCLLGLASLGLWQTAQADVRVDIKNETAEECSVAFNARTDKTKWVTQGWYVFVAGEEAPVILKGANDIHDVFIYHDCDLQASDKDEVKKAWINVKFKFTDYIPMENKDGYQEVPFIRLNSSSYTITRG